MATNKEKLKSMLDAMIDGNDEQAQVHIHSFVVDKVKTMIHGEQPAEEIVTPDPTIPAEKTEENNS